MIMGPQDQDLDGAIVCFDLETTGLSRTEEFPRGSLMP